MSKKFGIVDLMDALELGRDQLFYWIKTKRLVKPEIEGKGRGARSKFSIFNVFELAVIRELASLGIELNFIEQIIKNREITGLFKVKNGRKFHSGQLASKDNLIKTAFHKYQLNKKDNRTGEYYLMIFKDSSNKYKFFPIMDASALKQLDVKELFEIGLIDSAVFLNLHGILRELEKKIGEGV